jgi:DNA-binding CsgD family transcriptional regulator/tetratricopeptide (TPR) repeat protein
MSVFRGGFTREAAESVTGATLQTLASLVDKSLLRVNDNGRYDVHELLRQYGEAKLEAAVETEAIRDAHSAFYLDFLAQRAETIHTHKMVQVMDEIEADFENIRVAWYQAVARRNDAPISRAVEAFTWFCDRRNRFFDHEALYTHAQEELAPKFGEKPGLVLAQLMARRAALLMEYDMGAEKMAVAKTLLEASLVIVRQQDNRFEHAYTTFRLGHNLVAMFDSRALAHFEQSLVEFQELGHDYYMAQCLFWIGSHYRNLNQIEKYLHYVNRSVEQMQRIGDINSVAWFYWHIGITEFRRGHYLSSRARFYEAIDLFREVNNRLGHGDTICQLAIQAYWRGNFEESYSLVQESLEIVTNIVNESAWAEEIVACLRCVMDEVYDRSLSDAKHLFLQAPRWDHMLELMALCGLERYADAKWQLAVYLSESKAKQDLIFITQVLTIAAIICTNQDEVERAIELSGLLFAQPIELVGWVKRWGLVTRLLERLRADLGEKAFADAWERGKRLDLETVVAEIMTEFGVEQDGPNHTLVEPLTPRELEVLRLVAQGRSNRQIADELVIANTTVRGYVHVICQKLGAQNRTHAVTLARQLNLI